MYCKHEDGVFLSFLKAQTFKLGMLLNNKANQKCKAKVRKMHEKVFLLFNKTSWHHYRKIEDVSCVISFCLVTLLGCRRPRLSRNRLKKVV